MTLFADHVEDARNLAIAPNGDVFVAQSSSGRIAILRDTGASGTATSRAVFAQGFRRPFGLAFHDGALYVGDTGGVWKLPYRDGDLKAGAAPVRITPEGALGSGSGHNTRSIAVSPDGAAFYVAIGSQSNIAEDPSPRATIQKFTIDGKPLGTYASGLRNPVGLAFQPGTDTLFTVVNERDGLGDGLVPDYVTHVIEGGFYGWPYAYIGQNPQPKLAEKRPDLVAKTIVPDVLFESHSAPLGLVFYQGGQFPAAWRGDAFVALHGSWNKANPTGYKVVRIPFKAGKPAGGYENFVTGFWAKGTDNAEVWGRPVGLAMAKDGSLLIADDAGNAVWRVSADGH